jgi:LysR family transcriptional repressor of citA
VGPIECMEKKEINEQMIFNKYRLITHNHPGYWDTLLNEVKRCYPTIRTMTVNQVEVTKRFIEEGLGVSYLPFTVVKNEIKMNRMVEIKSDKIIPPESSTYVLTKVETDEVVLFVKFLQKSFSKI